jgi:lipoprotein-releasing system permease protein
VNRIFLLQGAILGTAGSLVGIALGTALALFFASQVRNPDGSATFPVDLTLWLYARSVAVALSVGVAAALIPARNAGRLDPATVIRNG